MALRNYAIVTLVYRSMDGPTCLVLRLKRKWVVYILLLAGYIVLCIIIF